MVIFNLLPRIWVTLTTSLIPNLKSPYSPFICLADRAYTLLNGTTFRAGIRLQLKINPPYGDYPEPEAHAGILHVKNLPNHIDNKSLYELFRPFGPMMLCKILLEQATTFKGNALVQYFNSEHAQDAEHLMVNLGFLLFFFSYFSHIYIYRITSSCRIISCKL